MDFCCPQLLVVRAAGLARTRLNLISDTNMISDSRQFGFPSPVLISDIKWITDMSLVTVICGSTDRTAFGRSSTSAGVGRFRIGLLESFASELIGDIYLLMARDVSTGVSPA